MTRVGVAQCRYENADSHKADYPEHETYPPVSFESFGEALISYHHVAYDEEHRIVEKIIPGIILCPKKVCEGDPDDGQRNEEEEYPASVLAPRGYSPDEMLTLVRSKVEKEGQYYERYEEEILEKPKVTGKQIEEEGMREGESRGD